MNKKDLERLVKMYVSLVEEVTELYYDMVETTMSFQVKAMSVLQEPPIPCDDVLGTARRFKSEEYKQIEAERKEFKLQYEARREVYERIIDELDEKFPELEDAVGKYWAKHD